MYRIGRLKLDIICLLIGHKDWWATSNLGCPPGARCWQCKRCGKGKHFT